jgi:hypothetical protein
MDNQHSSDLKKTASSLGISMSFVPPYAKQANRAERAIRTAKNHIIAVRSGFHESCPHTYIHKCLLQIEMTLNILHPFEYDHSISAYHGVHGASWNFRSHPIAPVGSQVLTWDSPEHRGSWADHGVAAVYLGPAPHHLRAFEVWVPNTSAPRITNTVWWFLKDTEPDESLLLPQHSNTAYSPTRTRLHPKNNGF